MKLRTSKALKYFAILLFSFEIMGPALVSSGDAISLRQDNHRTFIHSSHTSTFVCSLAIEENENEEEQRSSKDQLSGLDFGTAFVEFIDIEIPRIKSVETLQLAASQPPLFTLFHSYLI
jgi:hypothetical protein